MPRKIATQINRPQVRVRDHRTSKKVAEESGTDVSASQLRKIEQNVRRKLQAENEKKIRAEVEKREQAIRKREERIKRLRNQNRELAKKKAEKEKKEDETNLMDLIEEVAEQLDSVRERLSDEESGYQLGKVSFSFKVRPSSGGYNLALPSREELQSGGAGLSEFHFDLTPKDAGDEPSVTSVPDLRGLTESLARSRLRQSALEPDIRRIAVEPGEGNHGRVVRQAPQPETEVSTGEIVTIMIGQSIEDDE